MIVDCHVHILNADEAHLRTLLDAADREAIAFRNAEKLFWGAP